MSRAKGSPKTGGRQKGTPNKINLDTKATFARIVEKYGDPLEALAEMAFDPQHDISIRQNSMKEVVKYGYAQLKSIELTGKDGGAIEVETRLQLIDQITQLFQKNK